ncbi:MAG TPA: zinc-ribbon domain-containing protein [Terriglobales bacterium]|nr:zinc-ribbon domain-containing protein [Terriglobales bacterium]
MSISCPQCSAEMPDEAAFCPGCGRRMIAVPSAVASTGFLQENIAGALAYFTFIPAIVFLRMMPFKRNHFVRFHSFQSILLMMAGVLVALLMRLLFPLLTLIPWLGYLLAWLMVLLVSLAWVLLWAVTLIKAFQGELFKLPVIGGFAERA